MQVWGFDSFLVRKALLEIMPLARESAFQQPCYPCSLQATSSLFHSPLVAQPFSGKCPCNQSPHLLFKQQVQELSICVLSRWIGMPPVLPSVTTQSQRIKEEYIEGGGNSSSSVHIKGPLKAWVGKWHIQRHWQIGGRDACHLHSPQFCLLQTFRNRHFLESWCHFSSSSQSLNCNIHYFYNWIFNLQIKGQSITKKKVLFPKFNTGQWMKSALSGSIFLQLRSFFIYTH